jgi:glycosyltransferase involved in cell wall biosynthesis
MQNGYIVNDKDVDSLTKAIIWQLKNPAEAKKQAFAGKETAINNFSWENNIKKIINLINK